MRVDSIDYTKFASRKTSTFKDMWRLSHDPKFTNIKPIKTYSQYLREYGLNLKSKKK